MGWLFGTFLVKATQKGEKVVFEGEGEEAINFVDEEDDGLLGVLQQNVFDKFVEALGGGKAVSFFPPLAQFKFEAKA